MEAKQEAKLRMYRATENYCASNVPVISTNVAFMTAFGEFQAKIVAINSTAQRSEQILTGIAADKNVVKQKLCEMTAETAGVIFAYAATVGDLTLKNQMNLPVSGLMKMREDALAPRCQNVRDAGEANLGKLADYGITAAKLTVLQAAINDYSAQTPKPRTAYSERKTMNAVLVQLFEESDRILKERMDRLAQTFKAEFPDFVETYESTRRIVKPPTTTTQLKGTIVDKLAETPIKNAVITATPTKGDDPPLSTTSDADGEYLFKPIPNGDHSITVTAAGYAAFQADIDIMMGEVNDLDAELEK